MNKKYFEDIFQKISLRYPDVANPQSTLIASTYDNINKHLPAKIQRDIDFFVDVFSDMFQLKLDVGNMHSSFKEHYGSFYSRDPVADTICKMYPAFIKASLGFDHLADQAIELFPLSYNFKPLEFFSDDSAFHRQCFLFRLDGTLRNDEFIKKVAKKYEFQTLLSEIIRTDDVKALEFIKTDARFSSLVKGGRLLAKVKYLDVAPTSNCYRLLYPEQEETPFSYLQKLINVGPNTTLEDLDRFYKPEMARIVGHEFFYHRIQSLAGSPADRELFVRLVRDGADWYCGYKQLQLGHQALYTFKDCELSLHDKLADFIATSSNLWSNSKTLPVSGIASLMRAFDSQDIIPAMRGASDAKRIYAMTGDTQLISCFSSKEKRTQLLGDLEL